MEVVRHFTKAKLNGGLFDTELSLELKYYRTDPLAVALIFGQEGYDEVEWHVSRDMLRDGLKSCVGQGDVNFWPVTHTDQITMMFHSEDTASAMLVVAAREVRAFLRSTEQLVPFGEEEELVMAGFDDWLEDYR